MAGARVVIVHGVQTPLDTRGEGHLPAAQASTPLGYVMLAPLHSRRPGLPDARDFRGDLTDLRALFKVFFRASGACSLGGRVILVSTVNPWGVGVRSGGCERTRKNEFYVANVPFSAF